MKDGLRFAAVADLLWELARAGDRLDNIAWEAEHELDLSMRSVRQFRRYIDQVVSGLSDAVRRPSMQSAADVHPEISTFVTSVYAVANRIAENVSRGLPIIDTSGLTGETPDVRMMLNRIVKSLAVVRSELQDQASIAKDLHERFKNSPVALSKESQPFGDVFLCHSSSDKDFARSLASDLKRSGLRVWFDEWAMRPGDSLYDKIQSGIKDAGWFVIVLSPNAGFARTP